MPENTDHPTQKPEKLIAKLVLASSRPGDIVLDPFVGSGTTCVVAKKLGRHYLGIEIDEEYCLWAAKRLTRADKDLEIQGYNGGFFWEQLKTPLLRVSKVTPRCEKSRGKFHTQNACGIFCAGKGTGNGEYSSTGGDAYAGGRLADAQRAAVFPAT